MFHTSCHCERSEAILKAVKDCFVATPRLRRGRLLAMTLSDKLFTSLCGPEIAEQVADRAKS